MFDFNVSSHLVSTLLYNDPTGISEQEEEKLNKWLDDISDGHAYYITLLDGESIDNWVFCDFSNKLAECVKIKLEFI